MKTTNELQTTFTAAIIETPITSNKSLKSIEYPMKLEQHEDNINSRVWGIFLVVANRSTAYVQIAERGNLLNLRDVRRRRTVETET